MITDVKPILDFLSIPAADRDWAQGNELLLRYSGRLWAYKARAAHPERHAKLIEAELNKYAKFVMRNTNGRMKKEVARMAAKVEKAQPPMFEFKKGRRSDHDQLPEDIQALYYEIPNITRRMQHLHMRLRDLSLENAPCPDADRYPFIKELYQLDTKRHKMWAEYDAYQIAP